MENIAQQQNSTCSSCHALIDHWGFAFESYDPIGNVRTQSGGRPVDTSVWLDLDNTAHTIDGPGGMAEVLAASATVRVCFASQWIAFAQGRRSPEMNDCRAREVASHLLHAGGNIDEALVAVVRQTSFTRRQGSAPATAYSSQVFSPTTIDPVKLDSALLEFSTARARTVWNWVRQGTGAEEIDGYITVLGELSRPAL